MIKKIGIALSILIIIVLSIFICNINTSENVEDSIITQSISKIENTVEEKSLSLPETALDTPLSEVKDEQVSEAIPQEDLSKSAPKDIPEDTENIAQHIEQNEEFAPEIAQTDETEEHSEESKNDLKCVLSVRCDTVLNNMSKLKKEKAEIVPKDGIIFPETEVIFYEGESVFNVLSREMKKYKIHLDFQTTPIYNTAYIKGISNLYEFDCGDLSGWTYIVNGKIPAVGCSQYILKSGDKVEFAYTCEMGKDVGADI